MPFVIVSLNTYLITLFGKPTGIAFIDSTKIAEHGKGTMEWFFGFKLHPIVNHLGDILSVKITGGSVDDRKPVPEIVNDLSGKLYGDKGYLGKSLVSKLRYRGVSRITNIPKNMKKRAIRKWIKRCLASVILLK